MSRPNQRHREEPAQETRQAAPDGAQSRCDLVTAGKLAVFWVPTAEAVKMDDVERTIAYTACPTQPDATPTRKRFVRAGIRGMIPRAAERRAAHYSQKVRDLRGFPSSLAGGRSDSGRSCRNHLCSGGSHGESYRDYFRSGRGHGRSYWSHGCSGRSHGGSVRSHACGGRSHGRSGRRGKFVCRRGFQKAGKTISFTTSSGSANSPNSVVAMMRCSSMWSSEAESWPQS